MSFSRYVDTQSRVPFRVSRHALGCGFLFLFLLVFSYTKLHSQALGCTDPQANNFNSETSVNDGSCQYDKTKYKPTSFFLLPADVYESSGLIFYEDAIWTHNDSGNDPVLYKIDTLDASILKEVYVSNFRNRDWEDISQDEDYIYIGDFGNNYGNRKDLKILRILKTDIRDGYYDTVSAEAINFKYPDQASFKAKDRKNDFDCEAMIVTEDNIFLFSKNWLNKKTRLYALPKTIGTHTADLIDSLDVSGLITGAAYDADKEVVVLSGYSSYIPILWLLFDFDKNNFFSGNQRRINMPGIMGAQTEGICFSESENLLLSAENTKIFSQRVYRIPVAQWLYTSADYIYHVYYNEEISISPNPADSKVSVEIVGEHQQEPIVEVFDQMGNLCDLYFSVFTPTPKGCSVSINVDHLKAGFYIIKVSLANRVKVAKLIIN